MSNRDPNSGRDAAGRPHEPWLPYDKMNKRYLQLGKHTMVPVISDVQDVSKDQEYLDNTWEKLDTSKPWHYLRKPWHFLKKKTLTLLDKPWLYLKTFALFEKTLLLLKKTLILLDKTLVDLLLDKFWRSLRNTTFTTIPEPLFCEIVYFFNDKIPILFPVVRNLKMCFITVVINESPFCWPTNTILQKEQ